MLLLLAAASAAVLGNALALQEKARGTGDLAVETTAAPVSSAAPLPVPTPSPLFAAPDPATTTEAGSDAKAPAAGAKPAPKPRSAAVPTPSSKPAAAPVPAAPSATDAIPRPPADVAASPRLVAVQKALAKLGYGPLKVDGQTGAATRDAIIRFERDRRLPISGVVSDRLVRELNAVAGLNIQ
ncbi:peptidoglycan-binding domain-containing protein [Ancylobacter terrae]|uniref:peptidoglycan-binding domain-containing protein n=1 Tax=Ancylobacter sp. sgz301288 TaxID=3342077 RepID=UPI00385E2AD1